MTLPAPSTNRTRVPLVPTSIPISFMISGLCVLLSATVIVTATGCAHYQLRGQHDPRLRLIGSDAVTGVADHIEKHAGCAAAHLHCGLSDCSKRGIEQGGQLKVIEADQCQVGWQGQV